MQRALLLPLLSTLLLGCAPKASPVDGGAPDLGPSNALVAARPYDFNVPSNYDPQKPTPLLVLLHGYGETGFVQDAYFGLGQIADKKGMLYAFPNGTVDAKGQHFWNATDACCNFNNSPVDDVAYVTAVIDDMSAHYNVDPKRVFLAGHSNGGFMSHRMACDRADRIAAIVALAGDNWKDVSRCKPSQPVAVLQVHGDADTEVNFAGTQLEPSAQASIQSWVTLDGCNPAGDGSAMNIDLDTAVPGAETSITKWSGCKPGGGAEFWVMHDVAHLPHFQEPLWPELLTDWLLAHPKP